MVPVPSAAEAPPTAAFNLCLLLWMKKIMTEECEATFDLLRGAACALSSCLGVACEPGTDCKHGPGQVLAATQDPNVKQTAQHGSHDRQLRLGDPCDVCGDDDGSRRRSWMTSVV